jgi:DNA primase
VSGSRPTLDEFKSRLPLVDIVAKHVKLTRRAREWQGLCPFHKEKSPSFAVVEDKGFYHCFGCGAHGNAIDFIMQIEHLDFADALQRLEELTGIPAPRREGPAEPRVDPDLYAINQLAADWYVAQLDGGIGREARAYLATRGLRPALIETFGRGYAPGTGRALLEARQARGIPQGKLVEAGRVLGDEEGGRAPMDRFRHRLLFPIKDERGRVVGFGGRALGDAKPKYLNTGETALFKKGDLLYGLDLALPAARAQRRVVVVEGYMDVIALAQAGCGEAVAPLGTALAEAQLERRWRLADVPVLCFDGDNAGQKAAIRAAHRALPLLAPGHSLAFVTLPKGMDPDDLIRARGAAAMDSQLAETQPLVDRLWQHELGAGPLGTPEERAGLKRRLGELANSIGDASVRGEYLAEFRRRFDTHFAPAPRARQPRAPFVKGKRGQPWPPPPVGGDHPSAQAIRTAGIDPTLAKAVIAGLIRHPAEIARHVEVLGSLKFAGGALGRLFEAVVDVALEDQALDSTRLRTILATSGFDQIAVELLRADATAYSFNKADADPQRARADLNEAIAILVARPEVDAALEEATAALAARFSDEAFERQVALVREREALKTRLANLVQSNEDAKMLGAEGN